MQSLQQHPNKYTLNIKKLKYTNKYYIIEVRIGIIYSKETLTLINIIINKETNLGQHFVVISVHPLIFFYL
jgi:hypothetical protein